MTLKVSGTTNEINISRFFYLKIFRLKRKSCMTKSYIHDLNKKNTEALLQ